MVHNVYIIDICVCVQQYVCMTFWKINLGWVITLTVVVCRNTQHTCMEVPLYSSVCTLFVCFSMCVCVCVCVCMCVCVHLCVLASFCWLVYYCSRWRSIRTAEFQGAVFKHHWSHKFDYFFSPISSMRISSTYTHTHIHFGSHQFALDIFMRYSDEHLMLQWTSSLSFGSTEPLVCCLNFTLWRWKMHVKYLVKSLCSCIIREILKIVDLQVEIWRNWTWNCHLIYPTKAFFSVSRPHEAVDTMILSLLGEIKKGLSQWHCESDNGTTELITLSLEKTSEKEISNNFVPCLFIHFDI